MTDKQWIIFGFVFQGCFMARFMVQWIASERAKRSVVPTSFWFISIIGAAGLLVYAIHREDPVFALGQSTGFIIYVRNLVLIKRSEKAASKGPLEPEPVNPPPAPHL